MIVVDISGHLSEFPDPGKVVWVTSDGTFQLQGTLAASIPKSLRDPEVSTCFQSLAASSLEFLSWWNRISGIPQDRCIRLNMPPGLWELPWELLIDSLDIAHRPTIETTSFVRWTGDTELLSPTKLADPLRVLVVQGDPGGHSGLAWLDLERDFNSLSSAWHQLDFDIRQRITAPRLVRGTPANLIAELQAYKPHILWFCGHGEVGRLLFASEDEQSNNLCWITVDALGQMIDEAGWIPHYAVFWACDSGLPSDVYANTLSRPELFDVLSRRGVLAMLAMQSPIRDRSAITLSRELFRFLACGKSIAVALARARSVLKYSPGFGPHPLDWASPVLWSSHEPIENINWADASMQPAQMQLLGHMLMKTTADHTLQVVGTDLPSDEVMAASNRQFTWIVGDNSLTHHRHLWIRHLQSIQQRLSGFVIVMELQGDSSEQGLARWAEQVYSRLIPGDVPARFAEILDSLRRSPQSGFKKLLLLDEFTLAISNPPAFDRDNWFWRELLSHSGAGRLQVMSNYLPKEGLPPAWAVDHIESTEDVVNVLPIPQECVQIANALAALNSPFFASEVIRAFQLDPTWVQDWLEDSGLFLKTSSELRIMRASVQRRLLGSISGEELEDAHRYCLAMLVRRPLDTRTREMRLEHLHQLVKTRDVSVTIDPWLDSLRKEAEQLCGVYRLENRPYDIAALAREYRSMVRDFSEEGQLCVAWAWTQLGDTSKAGFLLQRLDTQDAQNTAWKLGLLAEVQKAASQRDDAKASIEQAIGVLKAALTGQVDQYRIEELQRSLRACENDHARIIQYLFHDRETASAMYEALLSEWGPRREAEIDIATVERNYSECLRSTARSMVDPLWTRAKELIGDADRRMSDAKYRYLSIRHEITYERARILEAEEKREEALALLDQCVYEAEEGHQFLVSAIAKNRKLWLAIHLGRRQFDASDWASIEGELASFSRHGWALRTLITGRLRAAQELFARKEYGGALAGLKRNLDFFQEQPAYAFGSDRDRIARTYAGVICSRYAIDPSSPQGWDDFLSAYSWSHSWLKDHGELSPEDTWKDVI